MSRHSKRNPELYERDYAPYDTAEIDYPSFTEVYEPKDIMDPHVAGIDTRDYPKFSDAYLEFGLIMDRDPWGREVARELHDYELDEINDNWSDWVHELALNQIF